MKHDIPVWDAWLRIAHWSLVLTVAGAWLSTVMFGWATVHEPAGYAAIVIVALRVIWGFSGGRYARFHHFVRRPAEVWRYVYAVVRGGAPRYVGHNPLGGWMIIALLSSIALTGFTGWLFTTDALWGVLWVQQLHNVCAWVVLILVMLHVLGVLHTSRTQRENLVQAMVTGDKPAPRDDDRL